MIANCDLLNSSLKTHKNTNPNPTQAIPVKISSCGGAPLAVFVTLIAFSNCGASEKTRPHVNLKTAPNSIRTATTKIEAGGLRGFITMSDYS